MASFSRALLVIALLVGACTSASGPSAVAPDGSADASSSSSDASDPCTHPAVPGLRVCCGQPGELAGSNCVPRQVIDDNLAHCVTEGQTFDAKMSSLGLFCCSGLTRSEAYFTTDAATSPDPTLPAGCGSPPPSIKICTRCGNGVCGDGENRCNCPADCPAVSACSNQRESAIGKLTPALDHVYNVTPGPRRVFITYKKSADIQPLPVCTDCGGCRTCPQRDAALAAIERQVIELQRCTVEHLQQIGGAFLERFALGNITLARLDRAQALDVATLIEVRQLEDADAPGPPPP
jgi:hypothetical protein